MTERTVFDIEDLEKVFRIVDGKLERLNRKRKIHEWKEVASNVNQTQGYCQVGIKGRRYMYHVILWVLFHKKNISEGLGIDHINGDKTDNRIENLRLVTQRENCQNRREHREGKLVGANYCKKKKNYKSQIMINNKKIHLGYYKTAKEAHEAHKTAYQHMEEYIDNKSFRSMIKTVDSLISL